MVTSVGVLNVILGIAYTSYGLITIWDMKRGWRTLGFSHFGAAWIAMAFTCGPHHLIHGSHVLFEGRAGGVLDVAAVAIGLPAGVAFLALRAEAMAGGRGDRFVSGTPSWLALLPAAGGAYVAALIASMLQTTGAITWPRQVAPNVLLVVLYCMIGYYLTRTQLRNHPSSGGWSVSGLSLSVIFPTCALMHGVYAFYVATLLYQDIDYHGWIVDWVGVPAAIYFLWVVRGLYRQALRDWNRRMVDASPPQVVTVGR